jgi:hypothetical protein
VCGCGRMPWRIPVTLNGRLIRRAGPWCAAVGRRCFDGRTDALFVAGCMLFLSTETCCDLEFSYLTTTLASHASRLTPHALRRSFLAAATSRLVQIPHRISKHGRGQHQGPHRRPQSRGGACPCAQCEAYLQLRCRDLEEEAASTAAQPAPTSLPATADGQQSAHTQQCSYDGTTARQSTPSRESTRITCPASTPSPSNQHDQQFWHPETNTNPSPSKVHGQSQPAPPRLERIYFYDRVRHIYAVAGFQ